MLSAVEGLEVVTPKLDSYVVPITLVILAVLFSVQRLGTGRVAAVFGPVTAIWFLAIAVAGVAHIADDLSVLYALNPYYAISYLASESGLAFVTIGAVFLAVTGAEALYVDLGHFGRKPIVLAWLALVFPSLLLNYFGQGAFVLAHGGLPDNPFFEMLPGWALVPMVGLATAATVIASQAVISGAFSLARQAVQLNILPRIEVQHTSETQSGQIYMPRVNLLLALGVMFLVVGFGESSALASAYGISVTGEMLMTTILLFIVMRRLWKWPLAGALALTLVFGIIDLGFFSANAVKVLDGGWVSIGVAALMGLIMVTWVQGSRYLFDKTRKNEIPLDFLAAQMIKKPPMLVPGTAVFLTSDPHSAPTALMHSLKHYKVLHEQNVILSAVTAQQPSVPDSERVDNGEDQRPVHAGDADLRLHGAAEHPQGVGDLPQAGLEVRHHDDVVLPVAPLAQGFAQFGDAGMAGPAVHRARPHRRRRHRVLPDPDRARRRNRHAGGNLAGNAQSAT